MMARLTEEIGELAREVNHYYGENPKKRLRIERNVEEELEMFYLLLICIANQFKY